MRLALRRTASAAPTLSALALLALVSFASPAHAQCDGNACTYAACASPARGVPSGLWGELRPTDMGMLPANRDSTDFNGVGSFENNPYWLNLDVEQGYVFAATTMRVQIWDVQSSPASPTLKFDRGINSAGLIWAADGHAFWVFEDVDAPPNKTDRMAIVGRYGVGIAIYDTSDKMNPSIKYQDNGPGATPSRNAKAVYATTIGGVDYAFIAADAQGGVYAGNRPSRFACVFIVPGSEPPSGSVRPKQPISSPFAIFGRYLCFCSSDPQAWIGNIQRLPWTETKLRRPLSPRSSSWQMSP